MKSPVKLYLRVRLPDGSYPYLKPAYASNGRLRPYHAICDGRATHFPASSYYLRYQHNGKRVWDPAGDDPSLALVNLQKKVHALQAVALGLPEPSSSPIFPSAPILTSSAIVEGDAQAVPTAKTYLSESIAEYLSDTANGKSKRTLYAYTRTLKVFAEICTKTYMEQIDRRDVLNYLKHLKASGNVPRTVSNYCDFLKIFFTHKKIVWPLEKTDRVKYTEKVVSSYQPEEITKLLGAADQEESEILQFFLFTGSRDQEVQYATWRDVDFTTKSFAVTEKLDLGFSPKDKEEGFIPIPDSLVEALRARRKRYPATRLIFPRSNGKPNGHFLRVLKRLALRTGMNCGHCYNKAGKCCSAKPVCKRFELHRFRKTFATMHHEAGISSRTIQRWLRHSDLNTTLAYLAASDDQSQRTREQVNNTFAAFSQVGGKA